VRWIALSLVALAGTRLGAQDASSQLPRWSPLQARADLPRFLPSSFSDASPAWARSLESGLFWTAGNPAALAWEVPPSRSDYRLTRANEQGEYRRPLDAPQTQFTRASASAQQPLTASSGVIGNILAESRTLGPGPRVDQAEANGSSPLVLVDTALAAMRSTTARLQGAGGWHVGRWAAGISAGYETRELHTENDGFVRRIRAVIPGAIVGVARLIAGRLDLTLGAHAGLRRMAETGDFVNEFARGRLFQLRGYRDVAPIDVSTFYYQRFEERTRFAGAELAGRLFGARWVAGAEKASRHEATWHATASDNPLTDRWAADGWTYRASGERRVGDRTVVTVHGRTSTLAGALMMSDESIGPSFDAHERLSEIQVGVRMQVSTQLGSVTSLSLRDEQRTRDDHAVNIRTDLAASEPTIGQSFYYAVTPRTSIIAGVTASWYRSRGSLPEPFARGTVYQTYVAPELALYASPANALTSHAEVRWRTWGAAVAWLAVESGAVSPTVTSSLALRPDGRRSNSIVSLGVSVE
jgi:hypothetical protein